MKKPLEFLKSAFVGAALDREHFPHLTSGRGEPLPEIAIAGRSNVGKSSLINHLLKTQGLARVSATPGKTQTINFYSADERLLLVDLPGYGFAKVPKGVRQEWGKYLDGYFYNREELKAILLLLDIRRDLSEEDLAMAAWANDRNKPLLVIFTKTDKATEVEMKKKGEEVKTLASFPPIFYSIREKAGRDQLIRTINAIL